MKPEFEQNMQIHFLNNKTPADYKNNDSYNLLP